MDDWETAEEDEGRWKREKKVIKGDGKREIREEKKREKEAT